MVFQQALNICRGVVQGDPLSPYLFIICLETFTIIVRGNKNIQGILVDNEEIKLEMFADDVTVFLKDIRSLEALFHTADLFSKCSGLEINFEKVNAWFKVITSPLRLRVSSPLETYS